MQANLRLCYGSVAHGKQDEVQPQLSLRRSHPAIASPPHQRSHEAQLRKRHVTVQIIAPRRQASLAPTNFSMFAGALQRLDPLKMKATIGLHSKPAPPIHPPPLARAQPKVAKTRDAAVPCPTATAQMLAAPGML